MADDSRSVSVYSSESGRLCRGCGRPGDRCACRAGAPRPPGDGTVRVGRETKGRGGRGVTVVTGLPLGGEALVELGRELKRLCGTGGTVKDGVVEIQGDQRERVLAELVRRGYRAKRSGG